jgi:hypothetical protein
MHSNGTVAGRTGGQCGRRGEQHSMATAVILDRKYMDAPDKENNTFIVWI